MKDFIVLIGYNHKYPSCGYEIMAQCFCNGSVSIDDVLANNIIKGVHYEKTRIADFSYDSIVHYRYDKYDKNLYHMGSFNAWQIHAVKYDANKFYLLSYEGQFCGRMPSDLGTDKIEISLFKGGDPMDVDNTKTVTRKLYHVGGHQYRFRFNGEWYHVRARKSSRVHVTYALCGVDVESYKTCVSK